LSSGLANLFAWGEWDAFRDIEGVLCVGCGIVEERAARRLFVREFGVVGTEVDDGVGG
jgi:hypothetical protein